MLRLSTNPLYLYPSALLLSLLSVNTIYISASVITTTPSSPLSSSLLSFQAGSSNNILFGDGDQVAADTAQTNEDDDNLVFTSSSVFSSNSLGEKTKPVEPISKIPLFGLPVSSFTPPFAIPNLFYGPRTILFPYISNPLTSNLLSVFKSIIKFPFLGHHHGHPLEPIDCSKYTIGEILNWTLHHTPKSDEKYHGLPLRRLAWLVNLSHPIQEVLYNPDAELTLFAPDDETLTPKHHRHHHSQQFDQDQLINSDRYDDESSTSDSYNDDATMSLFWEALDALSADPSGRAQGSNDEEDPEKEKKKKIFLRVIEYVLKYHVSPGYKTIFQILDQSTLPTALPISHSGTPKFRLRVGPALPHHFELGVVQLNFRTKLHYFRSRPILAKNGVIYVVEEHPLLPPLSPLSELFLFPQPFSTLTSALQKVHLNDVLLPRWENKTIPLSTSSPSERSWEGAIGLNNVDERVQDILDSLTHEHEGRLTKKSFTIFAPTNIAFQSLGLEANAFLFSPFGHHILRYVLSYHIVPDIIWYFDHCDKTAGGESTDCDLSAESYQTTALPTSSFIRPAGVFHPHHPSPHPGSTNVTHLSLPTLLGSRKNESLSAILVEHRPFEKAPTIRRAFIKPNYGESTLEAADKHGNIPVVVSNGPAWGGAIHLIPKLIHPPVPTHHQQRKDIQRAIELSILSPVQ